MTSDLFEWILGSARLDVWAPSHLCLGDVPFAELTRNSP